MDVDLFNKRQEVVSQCSAYVNIPNMLKKKERFLPFCDDETAERLYTLITKIPHNDEQLDLLFWGFVFITLLNIKTNKKIIYYFEKLEDSNHIDEKEIFRRFVSVAKT
jgi:hypothetical protein